MHKFSSLSRDQYIEDMTQASLDLLIIGGGITGAGIALDASLRGLKVGLIEMNDFASGTSSRSTKLIHGGLRYLKQMDVKLVAEVGRERAIVYENAPHVTKPQWMLLPIIEGGTYGSLMTSLGLKVYDLLAKVKKTERRKMLTKEETMKREPLLRKDILLGSGYYVEYVTDDARLTIEVLKKAVEKGAIASNYVKAEKLLYDDERVIGVEAIDRLTGKNTKIYAKKIVNAAGPWVDELREKDRSKKGKHLYITKGVHIVVPYERLPLKQAVYFDNHDGRMIFAIPKRGQTYIGTTDTPYDEDIERPLATKEDCNYLLTATNQMFPTVNLTQEDVQASWAGLRPLIHEEGKSPSEISRKDEIFQSPTGLISIAGGKLTGYRKMAERVVNLVSAQLNIFHECRSAQCKLSGGEKLVNTEYENKLIEQGNSFGLNKDQCLGLINRYGSNAEKVFSYAEQALVLQKSFSVPLPVILSILYSIEEEMTVNASDFFVRRSSDIYFNTQFVEENFQVVCELMALLCDWSDERYQYELRDIMRLISETKIDGENSM